MKKTILFLSLIALLFSCSKDDEFEENPLPLNGEQKIELKYTSGENNKALYVLISASSFTIDWGDGTSRTYKDLNITGYYTTYSHFYETPGVYSVTISTEGLDALAINKKKTNGQQPDNCLISDFKIGSSPILAYLEMGKVKNTTDLDLRACPQLQELSFEDCPDLKRVDLSKNKSLKILSLSENKIQKLELSHNSNLEKVTCSIMEELADINLSKSTELTQLKLVGTNLSSLDLSKNEKLTFLFSTYGKLAQLDLTNNTELEAFNCENNQLKSIKLADNKKIKGFTCRNNKLEADDLNKIFGQLQTTTDSFLLIKNNPGETTCDKSIATNKGWIFYDF